MFEFVLCVIHIGIFFSLFLFYFALQPFIFISLEALRLCQGFHSLATKNCVRVSIFKRNKIISMLSFCAFNPFYLVHFFPFVLASTPSSIRSLFIYFSNYFRVTTEYFIHSKYRKKTTNIASVWNYNKNLNVYHPSSDDRKYVTKHTMPTKEFHRVL